MPWLDPTCRPVWETGSGLNWTDFGTYWQTVGETAVAAVVAPVELLYTTTTAEGQTTIARGAQVLWNAPGASAQTIAQTYVAPFRDTYLGFACGDDLQIARGLTGVALSLWGSRGIGRTPRGGWLGGSEGAIRGHILGLIDDADASIISVNPAQLRWTQRTAGGRGRASTIRQSMAERGYDGAPIDVVRTVDGLVTVDHTRAAVALELGIEQIPARVHLPNEPLPNDMLGRFGNARTWGEAAAYRAANQRPPLPPTGTTDPPRLPPQE